MPYACNDAIRLAYETFRDDGGQPLLLISGTAVQMLIWPDELCQALVRRGFQVARFDNRDAGLSTHLDDRPAPGWLRSWLRPGSVPYRLSDMASDVVAVLDELGWAAAHLVGASLGGMVAQTVAIEHPDRVLTLTSIMSTPAARIATRPELKTIRAMIKIASEPVDDADDAARRAITFKRVVGSPRYPLDEGVIAEIARRSYERDPGDDDADARQRAAVMASGDRRRSLAQVTVPALVIHGDADPLIRPVGGRATARALPDARLVIYPGMGHDLARELWPSIVAVAARRPAGVSLATGSSRLAVG
jgi:pimeloyl-ACP methyl ester carboxylesterase